MKRVITASHMGDHLAAAKDWRDAYRIFTSIADFYFERGDYFINKKINEVYSIFQGEPAFDIAYEKWTS